MPVSSSPTLSLWETETFELKVVPDPDITSIVFDSNREGVGRELAGYLHFDSVEQLVKFSQWLQQALVDEGVVAATAPTSVELLPALRYAARYLDNAAEWLKCPEGRDAAVVADAAQKTNAILARIGEAT